MNKIYLISLIVTLCAFGCKGGGMDTTKIDFLGLESISQEKWAELAGKKIYFGHQSVGFNILDGIKDITRENPKIKLNIKETKNAADFNQPVFAHSRIGKNKDPNAKIDDFKKNIESGIGDKVDIAFLKLCYVDVTAETDIEEVFNYYKQAMAELKEKYPKVKFIHCTVPLNSTPTGIKTKIKRLIGKSLWTDDANIKRNMFNLKFEKLYAGKGTFFDLAKYEAISCQGKLCFFENKQTKYLSMCPEYTNDGGHLNKIGRIVAAKTLLRCLLGL